MGLPSVKCAFLILDSFTTALFTRQWIDRKCWQTALRQSGMTGIRLWDNAEIGASDGSADQEESVRGKKGCVVIGRKRATE